MACGGARGGSWGSLRDAPGGRDGPLRAPSLRRRRTRRPRAGPSYSSLPIATAVSAMRFEKPHSLSYQVRMRHSLPPSIALV